MINFLPMDKNILENLVDLQESSNAKDIDVLENDSNAPNQSSAQSSSKNNDLEQTENDAKGIIDWGHIKQ
jgi:hypothetical protein